NGRNLSVGEQRWALRGVSCGDGEPGKREIYTEQRTAAGVRARHVHGCRRLRTGFDANCDAAWGCSGGERETRRTGDCGTCEASGATGWEEFDVLYEDGSCR